ncbi:hypothetical protein [Pantoea stewartii]|uniref:Uncharacterized protein n=1 Tax=Pantoea stewartii subsp. stewartii DC283 TaxID=660596 RepID=H3RLK6_PANSE|nr:hypothetical protein [Pantoea stewartii]ARF52763.1 hypothetical protein DSJ_26510 [Pantoea stewartii subsp. stewartii DC283]EHT97719.1 hypothetical protein CKS_5581 [Pantoea stewartii subsp. stewartii DC283]KAB0554003.1 hypothetical protein F7Q90_12490 [Pantoea stewartii subsp. stewartii]
MKAAIVSTLAGVLLLAFVALGFLAFHYHAKAVADAGKISQLTSDNTLQASTIAGQALTFQTFNRLAASSQKHATKTASESEEKTIEYRTILKKEAVPVCSQLVPDSVSGGLYDYTDRLRSGAMSGAIAVADSAGTGPATARTLTYCQAVLWINPLLSALDKANDQLAGIRAEDAQRTATSK